MVSVFGEGSVQTISGIGAWTEQKQAEKRLAQIGENCLSGQREKKVWQVLWNSLRICLYGFFLVRG